MFGILGWGCWLAYLFCILSTILCVIYGIVMWNRGVEEGDEVVNLNINIESTQGERFLKGLISGRNAF